MTKRAAWTQKSSRCDVASKSSYRYAFEQFLYSLQNTIKSFKI